MNEKDEAKVVSIIAKVLDMGLSIVSHFVFNTNGNSPV